MSQVLDRPTIENLISQLAELKQGITDRKAQREQLDDQDRVAARESTELEIQIRGQQLEPAMGKHNGVHYTSDTGHPAIGTLIGVDGAVAIVVDSFQFRKRVPILKVKAVSHV